MKTFLAKKDAVQPKWYRIEAAGVPLPLPVYPARPALYASRCATWWSPCQAYNATS